MSIFLLGRCKTEDGKRMVAKHQDMMIWTFDHLMRKNRPNSETAAVVISNAIQILGDILLFKEEATNDFHRNFRVTSDVDGWLKRTLQYDLLWLVIAFNGSLLPCHLMGTMQGRTYGSPTGASANPQGDRQNTILQNFSKNCMKPRTFWSLGTIP